MGRDRLPELRQRTGEYAEDATEAELEELDKSEMSGELITVLEEAETLHRRVDEIHASTAEARRLRADPAYSGDSALQRRLEALLSRTTASGAPLCAALQRLSALAASADPLCARVARLQAAAARQRAAAALAAHRALLCELQARRRRLLAHQLRLMQRPLTGEQCERLLRAEEGEGEGEGQGGGSAHGGDGELLLFAGDVPAQTAAAVAALRAAEERHGDLLQIEGKLKEVNELFVQLALLVASQQESIDTVEQAASVASKRVDDGQRELLKGQVRRRKARRKKVWLWVCLSSGAMVVLLVLVLT